jgi:23S rRNA (uracil1939-C5)-methyltransferase
VRKKKKNIVLEKILVEDYAAEGKCLARVDGKVIFIEQVVPGDTVDLRVTKNKKDWAEAYPINFHSYAPDRVKPICEHFGVCGGCQWQMLPYEKQLFYKQKQVTETLKRIGKVSLPTMAPIAGAPETEYYRNKIEYTFGNKRFLLPQEINNPDISAFDNVAGFHARGFFDKVVDIKSCHLQAEPTNAIRLAIKELAKKYNWTFYDIREHHGFLRNMQVRLCNSGELMVNVIVAEDDKKKINLLMQSLLEQFPSITTLLYTINTKWNDSLFDLKPVAYHGKGYVIETLTESQSQKTFQFKIGPTSFFQTNTKQAEKLYQITHDFAECTGNETVYDLYCGTGSIGIFLSQHIKNLVGVELIEAAIDDAKENAALNNIESAKFFAGDVIKICNDEFFAKHGRPDVVITDPPRAGMHQDLVNKLLEINAPTIVYVSCNPATQARDVQLLSEKYEVTKIQPVDMFPHTLHIENVMQLKRRD